MPRTSQRPTTGRLLTIKEVAERLTLKPKTVRNWLSLRKLPYVEIARFTRVPEDAIEQYLAANTVDSIENQ